MAPRRRSDLFDTLRAPSHRFEPSEIVSLFGQVSQRRVDAITSELATYIRTNLPLAIDRRDGIADYRTNPYVLMTSASVLNLDDPGRFADFLFNSKLYMSLETSFGKSVEATVVGHYPIVGDDKWKDPPEKLAELAQLDGLSNEQRARRRTASAWREIDKSCFSGRRRYLTSIKSGPNTINDTQVQAMTSAIIDHHKTWATETRNSYPGVTDLDVVIGLTYGTERTTNNKENQILAKLLEHDFEEEDRANRPGVLIDVATGSTRVYRCIGMHFWAFMGNPSDPSAASFTFLEILLALAKALSTGISEADLETRINRKLQALSTALASIKFPRGSLPSWVREAFSEGELFWFATAMTAFFDEGI